jgi:hypothetical protein
MLNGRGDAQWKMLVMGEYDGNARERRRGIGLQKVQERGLLELKVAVRNGNGGSSGRDWQITHQPLNSGTCNDFLRRDMEEPLT